MSKSHAGQLGKPLFDLKIFSAESINLSEMGSSSTEHLPICLSLTCCTLTCLGQLLPERISSSFKRVLGDREGGRMEGV